MLLNNQDEIDALNEILESGPDAQLLLAETHLGEDAAEFVKSDLGRYVLGRMNIEINEMMLKLKTTFPLRWRRIQQLQNEIWKREAFKTYLLGAIQSGRSALSELSQREVDNG